MSDDAREAFLVSPDASARSCCPPNAHGELAPALEAPPKAGAFLSIAKNLDCYVAQPSGAAKGCVVVVHDIFGARSGRHSHICDELAAAGYIALCPDLFGDAASRESANLFPRYPPKNLRNLLEAIFCCKMGYVRRAVMLRWSVIRQKLKKVLKHAAQVERPGLPCMGLGFCWGAWTVARMLNGDAPLEYEGVLRCGVVFHPGPLGDLRDVQRPLVLCPAGDDSADFFPGGRAHKALEGPFWRGPFCSELDQVVPFDTMRHGFVTRGPLSDPAIATAYADAMALTIKVFDAHCAPL